MKHRTRFFGGIGTVLLIYVPLTVLEEYSAIFFIITFLLLGYGLGFFLERSGERSEKEKL